VIMRWCTSALVCLLVLFSPHSLAANPEAPSQAPAAAPAVPQQPKASPASVPPEVPVTRERDRLDRLEDQFAVVREYNDDFLSVVLWALGAVGTVTLALIGFNWFQSSRLLKKEFDAFRTEVNANLSSSSDQLSQRIDKELADIEKNVRAISAEIADEKVTKIRGQIAWLRSELLEVQYEAKEAEVRDWLKRDVVGNAVNTCGELIACAVRMNIDWRISQAIELLNDSLDQAKKGGQLLDAMELADLEAEIEKIPDNLKTSRSAVLHRLAEMHKAR